MSLSRARLNLQTFRSALRPDYLNGEGFLTKLADIPATDSPALNLKLFSNYSDATNL